jgi:hypothetical protein
MVFSSYLFLFYFLPAALLLYYAAPWRAKQLVLTALSYLFYGWANPLFVLLLATSTVVDFVAGSSWRRARLVTACQRPAARPDATNASAEPRSWLPS